MREFGRSYACRPSEIELVKDRARYDVNRLIHETVSCCVDVDIAGVEVVEGPHLDVLHRFATVGWRFSASSPTFDFAYRYLQKPVVEETLWQHAKRSLKSWWGRQRGRLS